MVVEIMHIILHGIKYIYMPACTCKSIVPMHGLLTGP